MRDLIRDACLQRHDWPEPRTGRADRLRPSDRVSAHAQDFGHRFARLVNPTLLNRHYFMAFRLLRTELGRDKTNQPLRSLWVVTPTSGKNVTAKPRGR